MGLKFLKKLKEYSDLKRINRKKVNLFTVYHRPRALFSSECVTPVHAGREVAFYGSKDGMISMDDYNWLCSNMIGDNTGDNISTLNRYYNEATVIYWIWKNCKSPIVGLMHYRRLFDISEFAESITNPEALKKYNINEKVICNLLNEYDIILPQKMNLSEGSIYEQYQKCHCIDDLDRALSIVKNKYPQLEKYTDILKTDNKAYFYNMIICKKETFDDYAKFLFDVLFDFTKDVEGRTERTIYQQRIEAFLAERLSNLYFNYLIEDKGYKVKELPVIYTDSPQEEKHLTIKKSVKPKSISFFVKIRF